MNSGITEHGAPLFRNNLHIQNVRIENCQEVGIYPKDYMLFADNPPESADAEQKEREEADTWYMEVLIEKLGRDSVTLEAAIKSSIVIADIGVFADSFK